MKQKINDLIMLVRQERKYQLMAAAAFVAVLFLVLHDPKTQRSPRPRQMTQNLPVESGAMSRDEAYGDLVTRFQGDLDTIKSQTTQNAKEITTIKQSAADSEQRTAEIFKKILERIADNQPGVSTAGVAGVDPVTIGDDDPIAQAVAQSNVAAEEMEQFGETQDAVAAPPAPPPPGKVAFVGAGDSVRIKLLAGVNAPTDGTPYPVVFKLVSDVYGPDGSALPLGEARLIAAAQGSLTDRRALFRITTLNLRLPDGRRKVYPVDGWVVGEDGLRGMEGLLLDPIGKAIGAGGMASGLQALGEGFAATQTTTNSFFGEATTSISGDPLKYAAGKTLGGFSKEWGAIVRDRVNQLVPHVQVLSGREATAIFAKSLAIYDLYEATEDGEDVMAGMD